VPLAIVGGSANLTDNHGNNYKQTNITPSGQKSPSSDEVSIYPQKEHHDLVVFEQPVENIQWLHPELPASNFGGSGMLRLEIPMANFMVSWHAARLAKTERAARSRSATLEEWMRLQGAYHRKVGAAEARLATVETNLYAVPR